MNIAVVIYAHQSKAADEDYVWFWRECVLDLPKCVYVHLQKKLAQGFLKESLQTVFPNNVQLSKFHEECG